MTKNDDICIGDIVELLPGPHYGMVVETTVALDIDGETFQYENKNFQKDYWQKIHHIDIGDDFDIIKVVFLPGGSKIYNYPSSVVKLVEKNVIVRNFIEKCEHKNDKEFEKGLIREKKIVKRAGCVSCGKKFRFFDKIKFDYDYGQISVFHAKCWKNGLNCPMS